MQAEITGLDLKEEVIDYCNKVARELGYDSLEFQKGNIKIILAHRMLIW